MKNLKKFVCNLDVIISGLSLCAIVVITLAGVIMRKIMNQPIAWLEEMQLLLFICDFLRRKRGIPLRKPGKY